MSARPALEGFEGCLLGLMTGDALGLPREALSRRRALRRFGETPRHAFIFRHGMVSDDTEHTWFVSQSLLAANGDPDKFSRALAWKLRLWLLGLPPAIGLATLRAILKLWMGFPPTRSGVHSAGNGPAMRAPILGVVFANDEAQLRESVRRSTCLTHTDPRAERGALAVAMAARYAAVHDRANFSTRELLDELKRLFPAEDAEAGRWLATVERALEEKWPEEKFLAALGCPKGVSGYVYHTVPAALWAWLAEPFDFEGGMRRILSLGGDADTTAAIFGGVCGAAVGAEGIPRAWLDGIWEFPRSVAWTRELARRLRAAASGSAQRPVPVFWPLIPLRNVLFILVVFVHALRRLIPF